MRVQMVLAWEYLRASVRPLARLRTGLVIVREDGSGDCHKAAPASFAAPGRLKEHGNAAVRIVGPGVTDEAGAASGASEGHRVRAERVR